MITTVVNPYQLKSLVYYFVSVTYRTLFMSCNYESVINITITYL